MKELTKKELKELLKKLTINNNNILTGFILIESLVTEFNSGVK
jgi:hypothetical protein